MLCMTNAMNTVNQMLSATVAGESVSDETIVRLAYGVENFELQLGYDGVTQANVGQYITALTSLRSRLTALRAAKPAPVATPVNVEVLMQIADLESRAQDLDDRDQFAKAGALRAQARALRNQVTA